mmetsp:Transcript_21535/g.46832  ORF Transcript_21535/g.46832 Transcript_21535/m.46832 type:complete len:285 (-) Transcript_21535:135-989(-)
MNMNMQMEAMGLGPTTKQRGKAIMAAKRRTEDPLKNWIRPLREDCPLCLIPLPTDELSETEYFPCCGNICCSGCSLNQLVVGCKGAKSLETMDTSCPFCRKKKSKEDNSFKQQMKLAKTGRPKAMYNVAGYYFRGERGVKKDITEALKWYHGALEAGSAEAGMALAGYSQMVEYDLTKACSYYQKASELGLPLAFGMLGNNLLTKGDIENSFLNYRKAAICGESENYVFNALRDGFMNGYITKEEYALTLRENQAARNEMSSKWRDIDKKSKSGDSSGNSSSQR